MGALRSRRDVDVALSEVKNSIERGGKVSVELLESVLEYAVERAIRLELSVVDAYEKEEGVVVIVLERRFF
jgi:hypothetical protein